MPAPEAGVGEQGWQLADREGRTVDGMSTRQYEQRGTQHGIRPRPPELLPLLMEHMQDVVHRELATSLGTVVGQHVEADRALAIARIDDIDVVPALTRQSLQQIGRHVGLRVKHSKAIATARVL